MRVSANELSSLVKRSMEGLGYNKGQWEDAARVVVWLEQRGLAGLTILNESLSRLNKTPSDLPVLKYREQFDGSMDIIDCNLFGRSLLVWSPPICDYALSQVHTAALALELVGVDHPACLLEALSSSAEYGIGAAVLWDELSGQNHVGRCCVFAAADVGDTLGEESAIVYRRYLTTQPSTQRQSATATILLDRDASRLIANVESCVERLQFDAVISEVTHCQLQASQRASLVDGIELDNQLFSSLNDLAKNVLVVASERSRMGAG
ncbi:MAG: DUF3726 domain-containing protein [Pseudomonadales bacterium]